MSARLAGFMRHVRTEGPLRALQLARHRTAAERWERRLGITTGGDHLLAAEGLAKEGHHDHSASSVLDLKRALRSACPDPGSEVFLDYGSGKGRAVLWAATLPFRRVIGVEVSPQLAGIAASNLEAARPHLRCPDVELVTASADSYDVPDDVSLVYFYNPFSGPVMERVCDRLRRSLALAPRPMTIVFATPPHFERAVAGQPWVRVRTEFMGLRRHMIFECLPGRASGRVPHSPITPAP